ncbi:transposase [Alicyclobacillus dauci]|uniref:Transposase n=1 Tax=Alicyclobacillus dauci TaxID=1475485 RepID=A0ABY6Z6X0_9BACL|nr:transposase [Alicyclobacillus dauci]
MPPRRHGSLINAISVWNTVYLTKATEFKRAQGGFQEELLNHISPLGWEHINFLGEYTFSLSQPRDLDSLRPLRSQNTNTLE